MPSGISISLDAEAVLDAFHDIKGATDKYVVKNNFDTYCAGFLPRATELAIAIFCNAFEELGCPIRSAAPGASLPRVRHSPKHEKYVGYIYTVLEKNGGLVETKGAEVIRTSKPCPSADIDAAFDGLLRDRPAQEAEIRLMRMTSGHFARCLAGEMDAIQFLFGSSEGRQLLDRLYAASDASRTVLEPLEDFVREVAGSWPSRSEPLRVLEVGAGTGGTTSRVLPVLAALGVPVSYTVTDLSAMLVSEASATFAQYPFVKYSVVDIEQEPEPELLRSQHIILGSNVLHATRDLKSSLKTIHKMLRPDGFLVIHEMTAQMLWADATFGLTEGWWRFDDGRTHPLQSPQAWKKVLESAGYGYVDWTDGRRPESKMQKLIFAMASDPGYVYNLGVISAYSHLVGAVFANLIVQERLCLEDCSEYRIGQGITARKDCVFKMIV